jgi:peptidoglycan-N-acetylglucosamine deacetylase
MSNINSVDKPKESERQVVHKVGPLKKMITWVWLKYEKLFHIVFRLRPIGDGKSFNYRIRKYTGHTIELLGAPPLKKGDYVMEMHFDNQMLFDLGMTSKTPVHVGLKIVKEVERALPLFGQEMLTVPGGDKVKALYGISMIHRGADSLGYQMFDLPKGFFSWTTNIYLKILVRVMHPSGNDRVRGDQKMKPRMLVMPRDMLAIWATDEEARSAVREKVRQLQKGDE